MHKHSQVCDVALHGHGIGAEFTHPSIIELMSLTSS
jgi:hypothetical protein